MSTSCYPIKSNKSFLGLPFVFLLSYNFLAVSERRLRHDGSGATHPSKRLKFVHDQIWSNTLIMNRKKKDKQELKSTLRYRPFHLLPRILADDSMGDRFKYRQHDNMSIQVNSEV